VPAVALSRAGARVVESGPGGEGLAADAWQRLEALPDPRSPRGRVYPLACLIAIAVCAFTAAGNDRFTAVGQWIKRAGQEDLARLRAPWDPIAGRYRAPDEKTIRVVLDRLDPRALTRAMLGPRRGSRRRGGEPSASVRGYRARRAARRARMLARGRLRAVAVDGKTSRGARRADGTRVHLLGAAEHGGHLLDHLEVGVRHNETSHFTELLEPVDLAGAVVTFDALCGRPHKASAVTSAPLMSIPSSSGLTCVISFVLASTSRWAITARAPVIIAASRCGAFPSLLLAPRTVLPSSAITSVPASASPASTWVASQAPNAAASACPSSLRSTRRNVGSDGGTRLSFRFRCASRASSASGGTSRAHSAIAATESAPAIAAATANASTTAARCRIPCLRRRSGTPSRHSNRLA
jgi:hypothetical protein